MHKALNAAEDYHVKMEITVVFGLKCKSPKFVPNVIEKIKKLCLSTKLKVDNGNFVFTNEEIPVFRIPNGFKDVKEATNYVSIHHSPNPKYSLATICANDDTVIINSSHACTDGVYMLNLYNTIRDDIECESPKAIYNMFDLYKDQIEAAEPYTSIDFINPKLTRFTSKDEKLTTMYAYSSRRCVKSKVRDMKCFDRKLQKPVGLTDALYAYHILSASAYEKKLDKCGVSTCVNLRPYLKTKDTFENTNQFSMIDIVANDVTYDTTIRELMKKTRESYQNHLQKGTIFGCQKPSNEPFDITKIIPGVRVGVSNVGQFKLGGPFDDVYIERTARNQGIPRVDIIHFSVIGENRNDLYSQYDFQYDTLTPREIDLLGNSLVYGLENIDLDESCGSALEKIINFQEKFIKTEYPKYLQ